jgi:hypothetical protein
MSWSGILGKTAVGLGAAAVPVVFAVAGADRRQQIPVVSVSAALGGTHPHASTGPDGSTGARTGTVGGTTVGATVGETVTTKVKTTSVACQ